MRLNDIETSPVHNRVSVGEFINALKLQHRLAQLGGAKRVYKITNTNKVAIVYLLDDSAKAIGIAWERGQKAAGTVYIWNTMNISKPADIAIDIPPTSDIKALMVKIEKEIAHPHAGIVESDESMNGDNITIGPAPDMSQEATDSIVRDLARKGELKLIARAPNGEYFVIPGMTERLKKLDRTLDQHVRKSSGGKSMEEQYKLLDEKVKMIATGASRHIKAMIVIGGPSSGKTFRVMKVLQELGLHAGADFVSKTGSISDSSLYRLLLENIEGMIVFDDCDSMWKSKDAANYLKGALNTGKTRTINKDTSNTKSVATLEVEDRLNWQLAASRILRNKPRLGDIALVCPELKAPTTQDKQAYAAYLADAQSKLRRNLPDQIDFEGRVIFISNLTRDQLDEAILTR
jgi:hypothetical protein